MNLQQVSGIIISSGFVLYVIAGVVAPGLYGDENIASRLAIIAANLARWNLSQLFFALGIGIPAAGFLLLALSHWGKRAIWLYYLGAATYGLGSLIGMVLVYWQTLDPAAFWEGAQIPLFIAIMLMLLSAGLFCFGLAMLQDDNLPNWLGYLLAGSAVIFLIATLVLRGEGSFFISVALLLVTFIAGIVIWRQQS